MRCLVVVALALACAAAQSTCETLATDCTSCYATASPAVEGGCVYCETSWLDGSDEVYMRRCMPLRVNDTLTRNASETCWALTRGMRTTQMSARVIAPDNAEGCVTPRGNGHLPSCAALVTLDNNSTTCVACTAQPHCLACTTPYTLQPGLWCVFYAHSTVCRENITQCAGSLSPTSTTTASAHTTVPSRAAAIVALAASGWALL